CTRAPSSPASPGQMNPRTLLGGAPTLDQPGCRLVVPGEVARCPALQASAPLDQAAILEDQLEPLPAVAVELHHRGDRLEDPREVGFRGWPIAAPDLPARGLVHVSRSLVSWTDCKRRAGPGELRSSVFCRQAARNDL